MTVYTYQQAQPEEKPKEEFTAVKLERAAQTDEEEFDCNKEIRRGLRNICVCFTVVLAIAFICFELFLAYHRVRLGLLLRDARQGRPVEVFTEKYDDLIEEYSMSNEDYANVRGTATLASLRERRSADALPEGKWTLAALRGAAYNVKPGGERRRPKIKLLSAVPKPLEEDSGAEDDA